MNMHEIAELASIRWFCLMRVRIGRGSRTTRFGNSIPWTNVDEIKLVAMGSGRLDGIYKN